MSSPPRLPSLSLGLPPHTWVLCVFLPDYGDSVAQELLARHAMPSSDSSNPVSIQSVTMLNGGIMPGQHRPLLVQWLLANPYIGPVARKVVVRPVFERSFSKVFGPDTKPTAEELAEHWALTSHNHGTDSVDLVLRYMHERQTNKQRWESTLWEATCPLYLINGALDPVSGAHVVTEYTKQLAARGLSDSPRRPPPSVLPHVAHYPQLEDTDGVWRAFADFHKLQGQ